MHSLGSIAIGRRKNGVKYFFLDESTLQQFLVRKRHVRRPVGQRFNEKYTLSTMKHPPPQVR